MVNWIRTVRILVAMTLVFGITNVAGLAQSVVEFNPQTSYVIPQQTFEVDFEVDAAMTGLHCFMVKLDFDRSLLELLDVAEGPLLQSQGETFFFDVDTAGVHDIGICLLGNGLAVDGPGVLVTLTFKALLTIGTTPLEIEAIDFSDVNQVPFSVIVNNGLVSIVPECCVGRVGDANGLGSDEPTIGDVSLMVHAKYIVATCVGTLNCLTEADVNQSGGLYSTCDDITIGDIEALIDYLFITGPETGTLADCL